MKGEMNGVEETYVEGWDQRWRMKLTIKNDIKGNGWDLGQTMTLTIQGLIRD